MLGRFEGELALLGNADEHDALAGLKARAIACRDVVLTLAALELDDWHHMLVGERLNCLNEAVVEWADGGRRGDPIAEVIAQEGAQLTRRLQLGHIAVEIQPVNGRSRQRDVVAQYRGDVGAWHRRRLPRGQG